MAGKIPAWGNFDIPSEVFDIHEWITDEFIDGEIGQNCTLHFPAKREECDNCIFDTHTNRSANIYKAGGPIPFDDNSMCPRCQGRGYAELPVTDTVRVRVYWEQAQWRAIGIAIADTDADCVIIGYMHDYPKIERADNIVLHNQLQDIKQYRVSPDGEMQPWGFRRTRYFVQAMKRQGGG